MGASIVEVPYDDLPEWVPTLAEALDACQGAKVNIEIKNDPDAPDYDADHQISDAVVGLALAFREPSDLLVSSFNIETVRRIRAVDPSVPVGLVTFQLMSPDMIIERAVAAGLTSRAPMGTHRRSPSGRAPARRRSAVSHLDGQRLRPHARARRHGRRRHHQRRRRRREEGRRRRVRHCSSHPASAWELVAVQPGVEERGRGRGR